MEVCLMIEGQEDVTWEDWRGAGRGLRRARGGDDVPLRPLPLGRRPPRARLARRLDDDRGAGRGDRAGCAWGRWSRRRPSATRRCWRSRPSPPTTSPAAGSRSGSGPAGGSASTRSTASTCRRSARAWTRSRSSCRSSAATGPRAPSTSRAPTTRRDELDARPKPVQQPRPPLILGGSGGPRSLRLAARYADEYNTVMSTAEEIADLRSASTRPAKPRTATRRPCRSR